MLYDIRLRLSHTYDQPADIRRQVFRVRPAEMPGRQTVRNAATLVSPTPSERQEHTDFFGTATTTICYATGPAKMEVPLSARVQVTAGALPLDLSAPLTKLASELSAITDLGPMSPLHFLAPSPRLPADREIGAHARQVLSEKVTAGDVVAAYGQLLHEDIAFDGTATTVDTPAIDAFRKRRGVCQDISHIMITGLREIGIPARYVSGFLRTEPPPGRDRLEGADAMHAWVSAWAGHERGWVEYDPTNACFAGPDHIVVGYGRDYSDVGPVRGVLRTSGGQSVAQAVDVTPIPRRQTPATSGAPGQS